MAKLKWGTPDSKTYEFGVDRGVLYLANEDGVAWDGLISVNETPSGGEPRPYYLDGIKYLNLSAAEEYEATIEAYGAPASFKKCEGVHEIQRGLFASQQTKHSFGFSYRTKSGGSLGDKQHYKIHLVYNARVGSTDKAYTTTSSEAEISTFSWPITTLPPAMTGRKRTAHLTIDSRHTPPNLLKVVEDILYGTDFIAPRMLSVDELFALFQSPGPVTRKNLERNPDFVNGPSAKTEVRRNLIPNPGLKSASSILSPVVFGTGGATNASMMSVGGPTGVVDSFERRTVTIAPYAPFNTYIDYTIPPGLVSPSKYYSASLYVRASKAFALSTMVTFVNSSGSTIGSVPNSPVYQTIPINTWVRLTRENFLTPENTAYVRLRVSLNANGPVPEVGDTLDFTGYVLEGGAVAGPYFDGSSPMHEGLTHRWVGAVNNSSSISEGFTPYGYPVGSLRTVVLLEPGILRFRLRENLSENVIAFAPEWARGGLVAGRYYSSAFYLRNVGTTPIAMQIEGQANTEANAGTTPFLTNRRTITIPNDSEWHYVVLPGDNAAAVGAWRYVLVIRAPLGGWTAPVSFDMRAPVLLEEGVEPLGEPFSGSTPSTNDRKYEWVGTPNGSESVMKTWL